MTLLLVRTIRRKAHVPPSAKRTENEALEEEPGPATLLLILPLRRHFALLSPLIGTPRFRHAGLRSRFCIIQVFSRDRDNIVIIAQLSRLGREAEIADRRDHRRLQALKTQIPLILALVLEFELEGLVLEVGKASLGRDVCATDPARRASHQLIVLAVVGLVIGRDAVAHHRHDVGEDGPGAIVLVRVKEDAEAFEAVYRAEYFACEAALLGEPHSEPVAVEVSFA